MRATALVLALWAGAAQATTYYATASGANINAASLWVPTSTGTCTGSGTAVALSALVDADILNSNNCAAAIVINADPCPSCAAGQAVKLQSGNTAGLGFTLNAATLAGATWHFGAQGQFASGVVVSGVSSGTPVINSGGQGFTGGGTANATGITDSHTGTSIQYIGNVTAGSASGTHGIQNNGTATIIVITGNCTGIFANGCHTAFQGTTTVNGNCTGSDTQVGSIGCNNAGTTRGNFTVNGNEINGLKGNGAQGVNFSVSGTVCSPADSSYVAFTGSNAGAAEDCTHTGGGAGKSNHAILTGGGGGAGGVTAAFGGWH